MEKQMRVDPKIVAAAERQMRNWVLAEQIASRGIEKSIVGRRVPRVGAYISISREAGACGGEIGQLVGRELGWEVLDKTLLDVIADRYHLCRAMLELVDETEFSWTHDVLGTFLDRHIIPHEKYLARLARIVRVAGRRGNVVIVGRGAHFLLPREQGTVVRLVASEKYRTQQLMERLGCDAARARQTMIAIDRGRAEFVKRFFHHDIADPQLYDLVINVERLGLPAAAELIVKVREEQIKRQAEEPRARGSFCSQVA
jgi:hypothetical protein